MSVYDRDKKLRYRWQLEQLEKIRSRLFTLCYALSRRADVPTEREIEGLRLLVDQLDSPLADFERD